MKVEIERLKHEAILDMTDFLIGYGFDPDDAYKTAKSFWEKHKEKLKKAITII